eukprot:scaffold6814_cov151-Amphora_coffeaeformis.AAC.1
MSDEGPEPANNQIYYGMIARRGRWAACWFLVLTGVAVSAILVGTTSLPGRKSTRCWDDYSMG